MVIWLIKQTEADMQDGLHKANNQAIYPTQAVIRVLGKQSLNLLLRPGSALVLLFLLLLVSSSHADAWSHRAPGLHRGSNILACFLHSKQV